MADKALGAEDKIHSADEDVVRVEMTDEERRKLDRRVTFKMDIRIMPWIIVCYFLNYMDRTNLGNARTLNNDKPGHSLVEVLDLQGDRYLLVVAVFFIPYVLFEFPSNIALKYFSPSRWISRIMVSWGIVTACTAAVTTYGGLMACRVMLGVAEAGFFPGILFYLCFWYPPHIRATRMAFFSASITLAGAFGGLIATGVGFMSGLGGLFGWQWLFLLEGLVTIIVGVAVWFFLPDYPETAKFFTEEERAWAVERMGPYAPKQSDKHFSKRDFIATIRSLEFWLFAITYFFLACSGGAFGYFAPTIIETLGYRGYMGQLMTVPPNVAGCIGIIGNSLWSDYRRQRTQHVLGAIAFIAIGWILLATVNNVGGRYVGVHMVACTNASIIPFVGYLSSTFSGSTSSGIAMGGVVAIANLSGIVAPYIFVASTAPRYFPGIMTLFGMLAASAAIVCFLWWRLGGGVDYRGPSEEQKLEQTGIKGEGDVETLSPAASRAQVPPTAELVEERERR